MTLLPSSPLKRRFCQTLCTVSPSSPRVDVTSLVAVPLLFLLHTFIQLGCFRSSLLEECVVGTDRISIGEPQYIYQVRQEIQMLVGTESGSSIVAKRRRRCASHQLCVMGCWRSFTTLWLVRRCRDRRATGFVGECDVCWARAFPLLTQRGDIWISRTRSDRRGRYGRGRKRGNAQMTRTKGAGMATQGGRILCPHSRRDMLRVLKVVIALHASRLETRRRARMPFYPLTLLLRVLIARQDIWRLGG